MWWQAVDLKLQLGGGLLSYRSQVTHPCEEAQSEERNVNLQLSAQLGCQRFVVSWVTHEVWRCKIDATVV